MACFQFSDLPAPFLVHLNERAAIHDRDVSPDPSSTAQTGTNMNPLQEFLKGGPDHRVAPDVGGAIFTPVDDSDEALRRFQTIAQRIEANDGFGYDVIHRLTHRSSDLRDSPIERIVINVHK
jgi:hypothetical protein